MIRASLIAVALFSLTLHAGAGRADALADLEKTPLVRALQDELKRSLTLHLPGMAKPYFIAYSVQDAEQLSVLGEFGGVVISQRQKSRVLHTDLRVGSYKRDNSNFLGGGGGRSMRLVIDDDYAALRRQIWLATDQAYKGAAEAMEQKKAALADKKPDKEQGDDFARAKAVRRSLPAAAALPEASAAEALVRKLGALLWDDAAVLEGVVELNFSRGTRTLVTSEGSLTSESFGVVELSVAAGAQAKDGMPLGHYMHRVYPLTGKLPAEAALKKALGRMLSELKALRTAPTAPEYAGPVLFEGRAAAQLLRQVLVPHLSRVPGAWGRGQRMPPHSKWAGKKGRRVLPSTFSLVDDPGLKRVGGVPVIGQLNVDDQGVPAQKVVLVKAGKLQSLLTNRTPSKKFPRSNGHARGGGYGGAQPVPTNLVLRAPGKADGALLRLTAGEAKKEGEPHGIVITQLPEPMITGKLSGVAAGGGAMHMAGMLAYKVSASGKRTLVRGLKLERVQVKQLKRIMAAGKRAVVHSRYDGGGFSHRGPRMGLPLSIVTPSLLVEEIELAKEMGSRTRDPLLPRPTQGR